MSLSGAVQVGAVAAQHVQLVPQDVGWHKAWNRLQASAYWATRPRVFVSPPAADHDGAGAAWGDGLRGVDGLF